MSKKRGLVKEYQGAVVIRGGIKLESFLELGMQGWLEEYKKQLPQAK